MNRERRVIASGLKNGGSLCKKIKILLEMEWNLLKVTQLWVNSTPLNISSKILLFLRSEPLFTPYGVIIFTLI